MFKLDREAIQKPGVYLTPSAIEALDTLETAIDKTFDSPVQRGRVIALRHTDRGGKSSAFSAALYLGKYGDVGNRKRLWGMFDAGHSFEPVRGESISFLYIGVGKPTYDHLTTYTIRQRRVCGGMRANPPWGFTVPHEAKNTEAFVSALSSMVGNYERMVEAGEQPQAARAILPANIILPPFQLDFSEETLAKNIFKQRIWQAGAQGETREIAEDMLACCKVIDPEKWERLERAVCEPLRHHRIMKALRRKDRATYDGLQMYFDNPEKSMWGSADMQRSAILRTHA